MSCRRALVPAFLVSVFGCASRAPSTDPNEAVVEYAMGVRALHAGAPSLAYERLSAAAALDPDCAMVRRELGIAALLLGRGDEAIASLEAARREGRTIALPELATAYRQAGRVTDSIAVWKRVAEAKPLAVSPLQQLHALYMLEERHREGLAYFTERVAQPPMPVFAVEALGDFHLRAGSPRKALERYTLAAEVGGERPSLTLKRNMALKRLVQPPLAAGAADEPLERTGAATAAGAGVRVPAPTGAPPTARAPVRRGDSRGR